MTTKIYIFILFTVVNMNMLKKKVKHKHLILHYSLYIPVHSKAVLGVLRSSWKSRMMFHSSFKWPILFWNITSVISIDSYFKKWQVIYSVLLMASCIYTIYMAPETVCKLEGICDSSWTTEIKGIFMKVIAFNCFTSRLMIILKGKTQLIRYEKNVGKCNALTPMTPWEMKVLKKISSLLIISCLLLTLPVSSIRIWDLSYRSDFTMIVFTFMYIQNFSMYCVETHFILLCFILYRKFVGINRDLMALKIDTVVRNNYPFMTQTQEKHGKNDNIGNYNKEILQSLAAGDPMTDFVEQLKLKHKSIRDAVKNLNDLFGVHLGLSVCTLCLCAMFDMYYFILGIMPMSKYNKIFYIWILQYTVRFVSVMVLSHLTAKQAVKSKILIADINNRSLDYNTKEELKLFFDQLCSCDIAFTACEFFTLNTRLITSVVSTGMSYLVILLQFHT